MKLEANKWYITKGGYLVHIKNVNETLAKASIETSPGVNSSGETVQKAHYGQQGWNYSNNGHISLSDEWSDKLTIVAEYTYPVNLPEGFEWKEGYPRLYYANELVADEDYYFSIMNNCARVNTSPSPFGWLAEVEQRRVGLVKVESPKSETKFTLEVDKWYVTKSGYLVNIVDKQGSFFIASLETSPGVTHYSQRQAKECSPHNQGWSYKNNGKVSDILDPQWMNDLEIVAEYPHQVKLPDGYLWKGGFPKLFKNSELDYTDCFICEIDRKVFSKINSAPFIGETRIGLIKNKSVESPVPVPIVESETMKKETAIAVAKVAGNLGFRALNYWFFEPAVNVFRPVVKGVRYAVFIGTLASAVYGYKHPEVVKDAIMSCLPTVSIEAPEILR